MKLNVQRSSVIPASKELAEYESKCFPKFPSPFFPHQHYFGNMKKKNIFSLIASASSFSNGKQEDGATGYRELLPEPSVSV